MTRPAAVDDVGLSGDKGALVACEIDCQGGDFLGRGDATHRLAGDELFAGFVVAADLFAEGMETLFKRGALHSAGADAVAANAFGDEVDSDGFR